MGGGARGVPRSQASGARVLEDADGVGSSQGLCLSRPLVPANTMLANNRMRCLRCISNHPPLVPWRSRTERAHRRRCSSQMPARSGFVNRRPPITRTHQRMADACSFGARRTSRRGREQSKAIESRPSNAAMSDHWPSGSCPARHAPPEADTPRLPASSPASGAPPRRPPKRLAPCSSSS